MYYLLKSKKTLSIYFNLASPKDRIRSDISNRDGIEEVGEK